MHSLWIGSFFLPELEPAPFHQRSSSSGSPFSLREVPPFFPVLVSVLLILVRQRFATSFSLYWLSSCFVLCSIVREICYFRNSENEHDFFDLFNDLRYIEPMTWIWAKLLWLGWMWIIYRNNFNHFLYIRNDRNIFFNFSNEMSTCVQWKFLEWV